MELLSKRCSPRPPWKRDSAALQYFSGEVETNGRFAPSKQGEQSKARTKANTEKNQEDWQGDPPDNEAEAIKEGEKEVITKEARPEVPHRTKEVRGEDLRMVKPVKARIEPMQLPERLENKKADEEKEGSRQKTQ